MPVISAIVRFRLPPGATRGQAMEDIRHTIPVYQREPELIRKQISLDLERGEGMSVYLWRDRAAAERFFAIAKATIREQTGHEPEVTLHETYVIVDNDSGTVWERAA
jgi:hypothetical protein